MSKILLGNAATGEPVYIDIPTLVSTRLLVAERTGYAASGGGFNNAISRLRTLELIQGKSTLSLTPDFAKAVRS